ncbi:amino acid adenylation domain-containing protein [Kutzneria sp. 744]|uniref:non-ribosomal peptide synthetase n=1 Tax=Kutzneria sp. (strain 744) TaxID=345341 RepID=UPI0018DD189E|nr:amino acid adenylation domain-containing protein [Kutzneria sp. 744]
MADPADLVFAPDKDVITYREALFERGAVERLAGHFRELLASAIAAPTTPVTELRLLGDVERQRMLLEWNDTGQPFPDKCLHELFERRAAEHGDDVAIACGAERFSYAQLDRLADHFAHHLRDMGLGHGDIVGICLHRSIEQAAAVLAVLKAGAAYLPLDPDYPADRLEFMVTDSVASAVLTDHDFLGRWEGVRTVPLDDLRAAAPLPVPFAADHDPEQPAYVIYTSGSTGKPKGIVLRHRGAVNNFIDFNSRFGIGPGDSVLAVSSASFDMSVYDLLGTLAAGATVVMPAREAARDPALWTRLLREHRVTVWHSAPALLELLLDAVERDGGGPLPLRLALLGGDWIAVTLPDRLRAVTSDLEFISLGGATEASMDSIIFPVAEVNPAWASIPYGRPMANQRAYVLDAAMQPVPVGVPGELHLAGVGLALGYLNRAELTAERFVERELAPGLRERLYKTGDLARFRPDGVIELLGRIDFQVKVHGMRIETGEVEAALRRHPDVLDAVVVARGQRGNTTLAAFVRPRAVDATPSDPVLRAFLAERLPQHMVPGVIAMVDRFPTTPNGKVDRRGLSEVELVSDAGEPLTDDTQRRIALVWQEILGTGPLNADSDFFRLGGDSFTAIKAMTAIDRTVPVVELLTHRTVAALADVVRRSDRRRGLIHRLTPGSAAAAVTLVCAPHSGGNAVSYQRLAAHLPATVELRAIALPGHDPGDRDPLLSFDEAARRCAEELAASVTGPVMVYGHSAGTALAVALARELEKRGVDLRHVFLGAAVPPADPGAVLREERAMTDRELYGALREIGGFAGDLGWSEVEPILHAARHDMRQAALFHLTATREEPEPLVTPAQCVFGADDLTTADHLTTHTRWLRHFDSVESMVIANAGHYFVKDRAAELAAIIRRALPAPGQG